MFSGLRFLWNATRGHRLRPWRSEYLRWRLETFTGKHADDVRARDFWLEGKKLGDLRRNPSVALTSVLTDPAGSPFYVPSTTLPSFGSKFCAPIPPQETNANPNFKP